MSKTVRVKVGSESDAPVRTMSEAAAKRLEQTNPQLYRILEPPKVEVMALPPLSPVDTQKKSVVVADEKPKK